MRLRVGLAMGCAGVIAGCGGDDGFDPWNVGEAESGVNVCADGPVIEGIDVAAYQPDTNWKAVADSGRKFAVIKATEGTGYVNSYFAQDWVGSKANGMVRGAYHYFRPDTDGVAQANHFLETVGALEGDELLVLDLETTDGQSNATVAKRAKDWMETVEAASGKKPIMYTGPNFWDNVIGAPAGFAEYPLWIAHYGVECPLVPGDWKKWAFHQYTSTGQVPGINNPNCDRDVFNGTFEDLKAFAGGDAPKLAQVGGNDALALVTSPGEKKTWLFARTAGGELAVLSSAHGESAWSEPELVGSKVGCGVSAAFAQKPAARGELVAAGDGADAQLATWSAEGWGDPAAFDGKGLTHPTTFAWPDGRMEAFAIDAEGQLMQRTTDAGTDVWSDWNALGDLELATGVSVIVRGDGKAQMFATDADGKGWHALSGEAAGEWAEWKPLEGELASRPVPVRWGDGHLELFARDADDELVHAVFDAGWKPFEKLGAGTKIAGEPSAIMNPGTFGTAGPEVVARDVDGQVLHLWWLGAAYGEWSAHFEQRAASDPFLWVRGDGHAELLVVDEDRQLVRSYHAADGWKAWEVVANAGFDPCVPDAGGGSSGGASGGSSGGDDDGDGDGSGVSAEVSAEADGGCAVVAGAARTRGAWWVLAVFAGASAVMRRRRRRGVPLAVVPSMLCALAGCGDDDSVGRGLNEDGAGGGIVGAGVGGGAADGGGPSAGSGAAGGDGAGSTTGADAGCPGGVTCVEALPFDDQRDTASEGSKLIDFYACKPEADESGPEIAYRVEVPSDGTLTVTVTDGDGVDIDVHILEELDGASCLARDDVSASTAVSAGTVWVVADTYVSAGAPQAGSFELDITLE